MEREKGRKTYRVVSFSCASCASTFEQNVADLPGVREVHVNFPASKVTVDGPVSVADLEKAGAFDRLAIYDEDDEIPMADHSFWKSNEMWRTLVAFLLIVMAWSISKTIPLEAISKIIYGFAIVLGGYTLLWQGLKNLVRFRFDMNTLMTVAIIGAACIGEWGEGAVVVFLFAISEALEASSMDRARRSLSSLMDIAPKEADVLKNGELVRMHVRDVRPGDIFVVKPGQNIALDGRVKTGHSSVNQASITGESMPVGKEPGDEVFSGTLNEEGLLHIQATKDYQDTTLAKIIHLVEKAQEERAPAQAFVDRFAQVYTPLIMLLAIGLAIVPPLFFAGDWSAWLYRGLTVLVVGCPCALVISTPVAVVTAIGNAAKHGVLIKGGVHMERMGKLRVIAFDKTGTLTRGVPQVTHVIGYAGNNNDEILRYAAAIEQGTNHPLARSIVNEAVKLRLSLPDANEFVTITGKGAQANIDGSTYMIGSPQLFANVLNDETKDDIEEAQQAGQTVMMLGTEKKLMGLITVSDEIRQSSRQTISELHKLGIGHTVMLTGDHEGTARVIANKSKVSEVHAELLPQEKLAWVQQLKMKYGKTAMIGDGMNDAPALAAADIGIAMGGAGTDSALEAADIVLMSDDLSKLPYTVRLSRKALSIIRGNIAFSLGIKALALLLILPGWLTLWMAIFADMGATLIVTLNALRLLRLNTD